MIDWPRRSISPSVNSSSMSSGCSESWPPHTARSGPARAARRPAAAARRPSRRGPAPAAGDRSRPPQQAGVGVIKGADNGPGDPLGDVVSRVVEVLEQPARPRSGGGQAAQRVARRHHAGDRVDAVPGDVADHDEQFLAGQQDSVVPVPADQAARFHRPVPDRQVNARGRGRLGVRRHDRALQADGELVLLRRPRFAVDQLVPGSVQGYLGEVVRRHILEGAAQRRHPGPGQHRLGEDLDLPDRPVIGTYHPEDRGGRLPLPQQPLPEPPQRLAVVRDHEIVQVSGGDRLGPQRVQAEDGERGVGPEGRARAQVLRPGAHAAEPLARDRASGRSGRPRCCAAR